MDHAYNTFPVFTGLVLYLFMHCSCLLWSERSWSAKPVSVTIAVFTGLVRCNRYDIMSHTGSQHFFLQSQPSYHPNQAAKVSTRQYRAVLLEWDQYGLIQPIVNGSSVSFQYLGSMVWYSQYGSMGWKSRPYGRRYCKKQKKEETTKWMRILCYSCNLHFTTNQA